MKDPEAGAEAISGVPLARRGGRFIIIGLIVGAVLFAWLTGSLTQIRPQQTDDAAPFHEEGGVTIRLSRPGAGVAILLSLVGLFFGLMADRLQRHWALILGGCMMTCSLALLLIALLPGGSLFLVLSAIVSTSSNSWGLLANASLALRFPRRRATVLSFYQVGAGIGGVGQTVTGILLGAFVQRGALVIFGAIALFIYAAIALFIALAVIRGMRDIGTWSGAPSQAGNRPGLASFLGSVLRNSRLWRVLVLVALSSSATSSLWVLLPFHLQRGGRSALAIVGYDFLFLVMGIVAAPVLGYLSDRLGRSRVLLPSFLALCGLFLLAALFGTQGILPLFVVVTGFLLGGNRLILTALGLDMVANEAFATTLGLLSLFKSVAALVSHLLASLLLAKWGTVADLYYLAGLFAVALVVLLTMPTSRPGGPRVERQAA